MHQAVHVSTILVVASVLLFFFLGIAIMVIMDHKARIPGGFKSDLLSVSGMRRDHPVLSFLTGTILVGIISVLVMEITVSMGAEFGFFKKVAPPELVEKLKEERSVERSRHFHNVPAKNLPMLGKQNVCLSCHGGYPHSKERMIRTLLNMHTQFVGCMTCHADPRKVPEKTIRLRWLNYSGIAVKGPPFGTDVNPKTGFLVDTDDYYSKIVPYQVEKNGQEKLLEITEDDPRAREFARIQAQLSDHDRQAIKKTFHRIVSPKGRFCSRCHAQEKQSYIPFRALGFSDARISDLTNLNIIGLVEKYKTFYMPSLLKSEKEKSLPSVEALTGPKRAAPKPTTEMRKDPRSWWRETYDAPKGGSDKKKH